MKRYEIVSEEWIGNGQWLVDVRDNGIEPGALRSFLASGTATSGARSAAKRVDPMRRATRTKLLELIQLPKGQAGYCFLVSRP